MEWLLKKIPNNIHNCQFTIRNCTNPTNDLTSRIKPSSTDKKYLIWAGRYKTVEEIPEYIAVDTIQKVKTKLRVRACNIMIGIALVGCAVMAFTGRRAAEKGYSVAKMNEDFHTEYNKNVEKKE